MLLLNVFDSQIILNLGEEKLDVKFSLIQH